MVRVSGILLGVGMLMLAGCILGHPPTITNTLDLPIELILRYDDGEITNSTVEPGVIESAGQRTGKASHVRELVIKVAGHILHQFNAEEVRLLIKMEQSYWGWWCIGRKTLYLIPIDGEMDPYDGREDCSRRKRLWTWPALGGELHSAAGMGDIDKVSRLLDAGLAVNATDDGGMTALVIAATIGHIEVVQLLLSAGAEVNASNRQGWTTLHFVAGDGKVEVVQLLLSAGAEVNAATRQGWTPLHFAAGNGKVEVVQLLLSAGAEVNAATRRGWTPLQIAADNGKVEVVQLLLSAGAEVNQN